MEEKTSEFLPSGIEIENEPLAFVETATLAPFTLTVARPTGKLSFELETVPVMVFCWAETWDDKNIQHINAHNPIRIFFNI